MESIPLHMVVAIGGFVIGIIFGVTVHRANFCMMGGVADLTLNQDTRRFRAWLFAMAIAVFGTQSLHILGVVDMTQTLYLVPRINWGGAIVGGLLFGFGMVMACGCSSRNLVNLGTGDLRALVALVFLGVFAYMTLHGLTALPRVALVNALTLDVSAWGQSSQGVVGLLQTYLGGRHLLRAGLALLAGSGLLWYCLRDKRFRQETRYLIAGGLLGLLVPLGWIVTGVLGADDFEATPLASLTFVAPIGNSLQYVMTYTGDRINFGVAVVFGVLAGTVTSALLNGSFRWQAFEDLHDLTRYIVGGALMGMGGVTALGCTVGQGITGVATLGLSSLMALVAIIAGAVIGVRYLEQGSMSDTVKAILNRTAS